MRCRRERGGLWSTVYFGCEVFFRSQRRLQLPLPSKNVYGDDQMFGLCCEFTNADFKLNNVECSIISRICNPIPYHKISS